MGQTALAGQWPPRRWGEVWSPDHSSGSRPAQVTGTSQLCPWPLGHKQALVASMTLSRVERQDPEMGSACSGLSHLEACRLGLGLRPRGHGLGAVCSGVVPFGNMPFEGHFPSHRNFSLSSHLLPKERMRQRAGYHQTASEVRVRMCP